MKTKILTSIFFLIILISCSREKEKYIEIKNPLNMERINEVIEIKYSSLTEILGVPSEGKIFIFEADDMLIPSQYIDYQKDGSYDDVLLEINMKASETKKITCKEVSLDEYPEFPQKTNIRFAGHEDFNTELTYAERLESTKTAVSSLKFQMEGPAWENDKIGFRNYFDLRNGMDIFGKTTSKMALDNVGVNKNTIGAPEESYGKTYHKLEDWGMDILKVGNSLGAGSIALFVDDSLYRVGDNGKGSYELIYEGPLRSEYRFSFPEWKAGDREYNITQYISITAGEYSYKSSLFIDDIEPGNEFTTGIVNLHSESYETMDMGESKFLLYTHDKQAYDTTTLFMGILTAKDIVSDFGQTREDGDGITQTFYLRMKTEKNTQLDYRFFAFWERSNPDFADLSYNLNIMEKEVNYNENPVQLLKK
jgi:hypothetical protein